MKKKILLTIATIIGIGTVISYIAAIQLTERSFEDVILPQIARDFSVVQRFTGLSSKTVGLFLTLRQRGAEEFARRWAEEVANTLRFYQRFVLEGKAKKNDVIQMAKRVLSSYNLGRFSYLFLVDSTGRIIYHPDNAKVGRKLSAVYPLLASTAAKSVKGTVYHFFHKPDLTVGWCKFKDWGWTIFTVVDDYRLNTISLANFVEIEKESLKKRILALRISDGYISIYSNEGRLIAYPYKSVREDDIPTSPFIRKVLSTGSGYFIYSINGEKRLKVFTEIAPYGWYVVLTVYMNKLNSAFEDSISKYMLPLAVALLLLLLLFTYKFIDKGVVMPILAVVEGLKKFSNGALDYRLHIPVEDEMKELVEGFNSMAEKIDNHRKRMLRDRERAELLLKAMYEIKDYTSKEKVAERISKVLVKTEKYTHVAILAVRGRRIVPLYATILFHRVSSIGVDEGVVGWSVRNKWARIVPDVKNDPYYLEISPYVKSEIAVPIMGKHEVIGVIDIESERLSAFDKSDEHFLKMLAEFLYSVFKRLELLDNWRSRVLELEGLFSILKSVAGKKSLREVSKEIVDRLFNIGNYHNVSLLLVDEGKLNMAYWRGIENADTEFNHIEILGKGIVARAARTGELQNIPDVLSDPDYIQVFKDVRSELAVPIKADKNVVGVINVESSVANAFKQQDEKFISSLADIIASVVHTLKEYERAEKMYRDLSESYRTLQNLTIQLEEKEEKLKQVNARLEDYLQKLASVNAELKEKTEELEEAYIQTIRVLVKVIERKDPYTRGHSERVAEYALKIGKALGLNEEEQKFLLYAGLLHDIGKIGVREEVLNKSGRLTEEEYEEVKKHPVYGAEILGEVRFLRRISSTVMHHHERWDGKGYPDGLEETEIPLSARIIAVADAYDAMTSSRSYRGALTVEDAIAELRKGKGSQFDPYIVDVFLEILEKIKRKRRINK